MSRTKKEIVAAIKQAEWFVQAQGGVIQYDANNKSGEVLEMQSGLLGIYHVRLAREKNAYAELTGKDYDTGMKIKEVVSGQVDAIEDYQQTQAASLDEQTVIENENSKVQITLTDSGTEVVREPEKKTIIRTKKRQIEQPKIKKRKWWQF